MPPPDAEGPVHRPGDDPTEPSPALSPVPIIVALVVVLVAGILASTFLRADDEGELVRPQRLTPTGDDSLRAVVPDQPDCGIVERAQVDLAEDRIYVELVVVGADGPCPDVVTDIVAEVVLPQPIGDRRLVPGVGRFRIPCTGRLSDVTCEPDR